MTVTVEMGVAMEGVAGMVSGYLKTLGIVLSIVIVEMAFVMKVKMKTAAGAIVVVVMAAATSLKERTFRLVPKTVSVNTIQIARKAMDAK